VCAGDLGTKADHLEHNLANIISLAHKWGAIILIDETDVFLSQHSTYDLERNSLVSVFLRYLKYFQGIMFLTTNRVTTFDAAFQSRINFAIKFDNLNTQAKKTIWNNFLEQIPVKKEEDPKQGNRSVQ
jgi:AAA+ superfamily predicted ATPase